MGLGSGAGFKDKKAGWHAVLADPQMPGRSRLCWTEIKHALEGDSP